MIRSNLSALEEILLPAFSPPILDENKKTKKSWKKTSHIPLNLSALEEILLPAFFVRQEFVIFFSFFQLFFFFSFQN